jgi:hypothetical protein
MSSKAVRGVCGERGTRGRCGQTSALDLLAKRCSLQGRFMCL